MEWDYVKYYVGVFFRSVQDGLLRICYGFGRAFRSLASEIGEYFHEFKQQKKLERQVYKEEYNKQRLNAIRKSAKNKAFGKGQASSSSVSFLKNKKKSILGNTSNKKLAILDDSKQKKFSWE